MENRAKQNHVGAIVLIVAIVFFIFGFAAHEVVAIWLEQERQKRRTLMQDALNAVRDKGYTGEKAQVFRQVFEKLNNRDLELFTSGFNKESKQNPTPEEMEVFNKVMQMCQKCRV